MLTKDQVKEYHEKGFVILDYKMPENDLEEIKDYHKVLLGKHPEFRDYCPTLLKYNLDFLKFRMFQKILKKQIRLFHFDCNCIEHPLTPKGHS